MKALSVSLVLCVAALGLLLYYRAQHSPATPAPSIGSHQSAAPDFEFTPLVPPRPAPTFRFIARDGTSENLADFRGQLILVNFWATWCRPCREEMPSLDRLQGQLGSRLTVLAISEDRSGAAAVDPFLVQFKIAALSVYFDPRNDAIQAFGLRGLPTSILINRNGRMLWRVAGAVDWTSAAAAAKLRPHLTPPALGIQRTSLGG